MMDFQFHVAADSIGLLLHGLLLTVELTLIVMALSLVFGLVVALAGRSQFALLRWIVKAYIEVIRGTPLLLQLIYIYFVLPEFGVTLDPFVAAVIALTLNYSAFISEVYRGAIQAVARGQYDAAAALGMTPGLSMRRIVVPQAVRSVIPALGNYFISLFKDTALCSVISMQEIMFKAQMTAAQNFQYFTLYTMVAIMYFAVSFPAARFVEHIDRISRRAFTRRTH
jgi:His/Glu/Gln/Arg/opine family amino acid ABC transporter permease subunit